MRNTSDEDPYVSVVVPVYQEEEVIEGLIKDIIREFGESPHAFEVIVVDDGSTDGTRSITQRLSTEFPGVLKVINQPYNKGNGAAVKAGVHAARGQVIACMDGDGQHDPREVVRMLSHMSQYDLVVGARTAGYEAGWHRSLANKLYSAFASWVTRFPIEDLTSGCRIFRAELVKRYAHLFPARFSYPTTSTLAFIKAGHNVAHVPMKVHARRTGASKIKLLTDGIGFLVIILKIIVVFEPLRVFMPVATSLFVLAVVAMTHSVWSVGRLFIPNSAVILFVVGVVVLLLGLVAEQVAALQVSHYEERR